MSRERRFSREAVLGSGVELFDRAGCALVDWEMHRRAGLVVVTDGPAAPGRTVTLRPRAGHLTRRYLAALRDDD